MKKHSSANSTLRADVYIDERKGEIIKKELEREGELNKPKPVSKYFIDIWSAYWDCKQRTGMDITRVVNEFLKLKASSKT